MFAMVSLSEPTPSTDPQLASVSCVTEFLSKQRAARIHRVCEESRANGGTDGSEPAVAAGAIGGSPRGAGGRRRPRRGGTVDHRPPRRTCSRACLEAILHGGPGRDPVGPDRVRRVRRRRRRRARACPGDRPRQDGDGLRGRASRPGRPGRSGSRDHHGAARRGGPARQGPGLPDPGWTHAAQDPCPDHARRELRPRPGRGTAARACGGVPRRRRPAAGDQGPDPGRRVRSGHAAPARGAVRRGPGPRLRGRRRRCAVAR